VFCLYNFCLINFHSKKNIGRYYHKCPYLPPTVGYPLLLSGIKENRNFSTEFRKILQYEISRKYVQWEPSCSMRRDGRADMTDLVVDFRNFATAPKNIFHLPPPATFCALVTIQRHNITLTLSAFVSKKKEWRVQPFGSPVANVYFRINLSKYKRALFRLIAFRDRA